MRAVEVSICGMKLFSRWRLWLAAGRRGLRRVQLRGGKKDFLQLLETEGCRVVPGRWTAAAERQLHAYLQGDRRCFKLRLDPPALSFFCRRVLRELEKVPPGRTITYGELAARAGYPGAGRAVGAAMAANPLPIIWPCHRVVGRKGLTGFGGGLDLKQALLEHEEGTIGRRKKPG